MTITDPPLRHLTIRNRNGSRQHFYHFLLGILLPLCRYLALTGESSLPLIVGSCGPLDAILHELELPRLLLAERHSHQNLARSLPSSIARKLVVIGFDLNTPSDGYDRSAILPGADWLRERWQARIAGLRRQLQERWSEEPRILIIDRGPPDPFYTSWLSERPNAAGSVRRRVANHKEMASAVTHHFPGCRSVLLEGLPLAAQIALFEMADVVIAQHGAALSNVVWMRPESRVIEFEGGAPKDMGYFTKLSAILGLTHRLFPQDGPFGPVDATALTATIGEMLGSAGAEAKPHSQSDMSPA